jgi:flagellin-like protein
VNSQGGKIPKMRKLLKSKKALSPVVAAIILIAVTVAVSIAVAAWMGSLTIGFMETSELTITDVTFTDDGGTPPAAVSIDLDITNSGTSDVTVTLVKVNGVTIDVTDTTYTAGQTDGTLSITYATWQAGNKYAISLFAADGTMVGSYTDTA